MTPQELQAKAADYSMQYSKGEISREEFAELVSDLQISQAIRDNSADFEQQQQIREYLLQVAQLAQAISSL